MGTNCAPHVPNLFLFSYRRDFMLCLSDNNKTDIIEVYKSTARYLDDLLNIDNPYFEQMVAKVRYVLLNFSKIRRVLLILKLRF